MTTLETLRELDEFCGSRPTLKYLWLKLLMCASAQLRRELQQGFKLPGAESVGCAQFDELCDRLRILLQRQGITPPRLTLKSFADYIVSYT